MFKLRSTGSIYSFSLFFRNVLVSVLGLGLACLNLLACVSYQDLQTREQTAVKIVGFAKDTNKSIRTGLLCIEQAGMHWFLLKASSSDKTENV